MLLKQTLKNIPKLPGVYQYFNKKGQIIYIGKSVNLNSRVNSYFNSTKKLNFAKKKMVSEIDKIETIVTNTTIESLLLETTLIKKHKPKYNILMKDDKSHTYIKITNDIFPKIIKTRASPKYYIGKENKKGGIYFGPYISTNHVNNLLKLIKKTFSYRSCNIIFKKSNDKIKIKSSSGIKIPCIDYYIDRCSGPCLLKKENIKKYLENIKNIKNFLSGDFENIIKDLNLKMLEYSNKLEFEKAHKLKQDIEAIKTLKENQIVKDIVGFDADFINFLEKYDKYYISKIEVRQKKIVGIYNFEIINKLKDLDDSIKYFIENNYIENKNKITLFLPKNIKIENEILTELNLKIFIPKIGEKTDILKLAYKNAFEFAYKKHLESLSVKGFTKKDMKDLLSILGYKEINKNIIFECNDISHISGNHTVASRSVIENGKTNPSKYRKFKLKTIDIGKIDDFASLSEIIKRRLKEIKNTLTIPDLIVIDGGKGQLSSVLKIVEEAKKFETDKNILDLFNFMQIVSIAKKEEELFLPNKKESILIPKDSNILRMIQKLRDEAHRFAITFNRDLRIKSSKKNVLEELPGIGAKTRSKLLKHYGSIKNIKNDEELKKLLTKNQIEVLENHGFIE